MFNFRCRNISINVGFVTTTIKYDDTNNFIKEPTVVAKDLRTNEFFAFGYKAESLTGRVPATRMNVKIFENGKVVDRDALLYFIIGISKQFGPKNKINLLVSFSCFEKNSFKFSLKKDLLSKGFKKVIIVDELSAITFFLMKEKNISLKNYLIIDLSTFNATIGYFSNNKAIVRIINYGKFQFDRSFKRILIDKYNLIVNDTIAEYSKKYFDPNCINSSIENIYFVVKGIDKNTGLSKTIRVSNNLVNKIVEVLINKLLSNIRDFLLELNTRFRLNIVNNKIILIGSNKSLKNISKIISNQLSTSVIDYQGSTDSAVIGGWLILLNSNKNNKKK